jgi:putative lipoprotein
MKTKVISSLFVAILLAWAPSVQAQESSQDAAADLSGPTWQLVKFQGSDDKALVPDDQSKYTITFKPDRSVTVRIDCNRGHGTWKSSGPDELEFGPLALTRAMSPAALLNERITKDWQYVRSYTMKDGHLFLALMADGGIYEFEPGSLEAKAGGAVNGIATYRERMALPPNAVFEATLEDVSKADGPAEMIGETRFEWPGNSPIPFKITYDPSRIDASHSYVVRGRILVAGKLFFTTDQHYPVLTEGKGNEVRLLLRRAGTSSTAGGTAEGPGTPPAAASSGEPLENTYWKLTRLGDTPVTAASQQEEPYLVLNSETRRVAGSGGCNRLTGSYELNGDNLTFGKMAGTMMACIEGMETEKAFQQALTQVNSWKITGQHLELLDAASNVIASFEARHMK